MKTSLTLVTFILAGSLLAACASKPEPYTPPPTTEERVSEAKPVERVTQRIPVRPRTEASNSYRGPAPGSLEEFQVAVGDRIYFDLDSSDLTPDARNLLLNQADWLRRYPAVRVLISGNCDERGTREYNLALGARRAEAARSFLISQGISNSRIETISYGKERPIDPRSAPAAWAVNRNAHTLIVSGLSS